MSPGRFYIKLPGGTGHRLTFAAPELDCKPSFTIPFGAEYGLAPPNIQRAVLADTDGQQNSGTGADKNTRSNSKR